MTLNKASTILVGILLSGLIIGCQPKGIDNTESLDKTATDQSTKATHQDTFEYKGAYVGDNSAVGNILTRLPVSSSSKDFELSTVTEPYGVTVNYDGSEPPQQRSRIIVYTATYLMSLLRNADWVTLNFGDQTVRLTKAQLQEWYGRDLSSFDNEEQLNTAIEAQLANELKVNQLLQ
ncbi:MAG: DUF4825 domain-containing protein [Psychrobacter sp.]|nr:DUF4825 domain-containing protein [Psychrobacter sp.]